jgi:hypothetical protein
VATSTVSEAQLDPSISTGLLRVALGHESTIALSLHNNNKSDVQFRRSVDRRSDWVLMLYSTGIKNRSLLCRIDIMAPARHLVSKADVTRLLTIALLLVSVYSLTEGLGA